MTFARSNICANDICVKYWQPILTQPNLWAGLAQLTTFPPHLTLCLSPSPSYSLRANVVCANVASSKCHYTDFITQAFDWRFDGSILKDIFSNDNELLESIHKVVEQSLGLAILTREV